MTATPAAPRARAFLCALLGLSAAAVPARAETLDDRHLPVIARSAADLAKIATLLAPPENFTALEPFEAKPAGAATVPLRGDADAFGQPAANMPVARAADFTRGKALFRKTWIAAPAATKGSDGLG
ncbi:MAG: thiol oxidoreductase, partial [Rhodobacteraceae bacterium]|nr:thiol oxidoreductase [Paracoccaceae bacterium]